MSATDQPRTSSGTVIRLVGGTLGFLLAGGAAIWCVDYSGLTSNIEPGPVESIIVATVHDSGSPVDPANLGALRVETGVPDFALSAPAPLTLAMTVQASGAAAEEGLIQPFFLIGGRLVEYLSECGNVAPSLLGFEDLDVESQSAALAAVEEQMARVQSFDSFSELEVSSRAVRDLAAGMTYATVPLPLADSAAQWDQSMPDDARTVPTESEETPRPSTQSFTGIEWSQSCTVTEGVSTAETWGSRLDLPSAGVAVPYAWGQSDAAPTEGGIPGVPVEVESSLGWERNSVDFDLLLTAEESTTRALLSENERADSLEAKGLVNKDSPQYLMGEAQVGIGESKVVDGVYYLSPGRFSLRFATTFYSATQDMALFASGALFGLAATLLIAVVKTLVRLYIRAPKP